MEDLVVKNVSFCGTKLLAVQEKETGKIYAGVNSILRELGFNEEQVRYRRDKWNTDKVLSKGVQKFSHPSKNGGMQETYCIEIKRLPLALAKIEITPKMEKSMPGLSGRLETYQESCADVLAAAFLPEPKAPKPHSVKPLTITSRVLCGINGRRAQQHVEVLREIEECIKELEEMGIDRQDFFIDSSYRMMNNKEKSYPQFLCTRKGCEYYANKLQHREEFLSEVNARFDQMQDVIDGKPTHLKRQAVADRGAFVGLYSYNDHGILIVENDVYLLDEKQTDMFSVLIPELQFRNVCQIKEVISSLLESVEKAEKMEAIFETKIENPNADEESQKMLPDNLEKSNKEIEVPLDQVANLNKKQARARYGIGEQYLIEIADEIGATVRIGRRRFFDRKKMDAHFERIAE